MEKLTKGQKEAAKQGDLLREMVKTPGWEEVLKPHLENLIYHSWLDPQGVKDKDKFFYEYAVTWAKAESAQQIIDWVNGMVSQAEELRKIEKGEIPADKFREAVS